MVLFFFYNKLTNIDLIKKINNIYEINDGYILIKNMDIDNNILNICDQAINNNQLLSGKLVRFDMSINDAIKKINGIDECKIENKIKYTLKSIWANKTSGGVYKAYIIF